MQSSLFLLLASFSLLVLPLSATTVIPPDFTTMAQRSDYVVHGVVTEVKSLREDREGRLRIVTRVTFRPIEVVAGEAPATIELQLLGGTVGEQRMEVSGQPHFKVGDEEILFVHQNGRSISPLYAMMFGRYPVKTDPVSGEKRVHREDGFALHSVAEISTPLAHTHAEDETVSRTATAAPTDARGLTPAAFIAQIKAARTKPNSAGQE